MTSTPTPAGENATPNGWRVEKWHPMGELAKWLILSGDNTHIGEFKREARANEAVHSVNTAPALAKALEAVVQAVTPVNYVGNMPIEEHPHFGPLSAALGTAEQTLAAWRGER